MCFTPHLPNLIINLRLSWLHKHQKQSVTKQFICIQWILAGVRHKMTTNIVQKLCGSDCRSVQRSRYLSRPSNVSPNFTAYVILCKCRVFHKQIYSLFICPPSHKATSYFSILHFLQCPYHTVADNKLAANHTRTKPSSHSCGSAKNLHY